MGDIVLMEIHMDRMECHTVAPCTIPMDHLMVILVHMVIYIQAFLLMITKDVLYSTPKKAPETHSRV